MLAGDRAAGTAPRARLRSPEALSRIHEWLRELATAASERPLRSLRTVLVLNLVAAALFVPLGLALASDQALLFRELAPGTWLSFAQLLFIAATAWAVYETDERAAARRSLPGWRRYDDFWALSVGLFLLFAIDEVTQATVFLGKWMSGGLGVSPPAPFNDIDAILLVLLFGTGALILSRRATILRGHPRALALFVVAGLSGAASQTLDAVVPATRWEFVAEESFKMVAEAFFIGAYLVVLRDVRARRNASAERLA